MYRLETIRDEEYSYGISCDGRESFGVVSGSVCEGSCYIARECEIARILEECHESKSCLGFVHGVYVGLAIQRIKTCSIKFNSGELTLSHVPLGIHEDSIVVNRVSIVWSGVFSVHRGGRIDGERLLHIREILDTGRVPCAATVSRKTDHADG